MLNFHFDFNLFNSNYYLYERLLVFLFSLVPAILLVVFILYTDRKSKEPIKNILLCLFSGMLTISLARELETFIMPYISNNILLTYIFAFMEEISKMGIFIIFIFDNKYFDDIYDGIVYMSLIALSFAGIENIMYAFSESTVTESITLALMRDFTTIPLHVICGVVIGYFLSLSSFSKDIKHKIINIIFAITVSTLIHGTFNNLMTLLSDIEVNPDRSLQILLFTILPLVIIMIVLLIISIKYINKTLELNEIYIHNQKYDNKYKYLMVYDDFLSSPSFIQRKKRYNVLKINKSKKVNDSIDELLEIVDKS